MSHFCVVIIGDNWQEQLAPYHEFECTGQVDEYVQDMDITQEFLDQIKQSQENQEDDPLQAALEWYGMDDQVVERLEDVDREDAHKYGFAVIKDGEVEQVVRRTNPKAKWDWYELGGRWRGYFRLRPGTQGVVGQPGAFDNTAEPGWADQVRKGDVDWDGMRKDAGNQAANYWDLVHKHAPDGWESFDSVHGRMGEIEKAREFYWNQPGRLALKNCGDSQMIWVEDTVLVSRDQYIQNAENSAGVSFALIKDGEWIERGEMGWFGMHTDSMDYATWCAKFRELIDSLDDNVMLSAVDCHI